ncbi:CpsD/CapB family tyrosine-protein kinase [Candidatus Chloroploca sp. M-50]|uniref:CpsD/CapB family tyrosine-protein kinase n=1 Tax=Candidatus Chloroploca mongolica TaxID=2528176 RepID=A0ABS4DBS3_9CHLR|nr:CpsD/CapB family tyrosine-protein kinase [Candidatus Chloroploca mongolica]MBP1466884.1 CpsD/CapB family tyrosine-protein kinase [Candidatus Chloroploca mongolica]
MLSRRKERMPVDGAEYELMLSTADGKDMLAFSGEVVTSMRRMLTTLMYQSTMPRSIACISALQQEGVTYLTLAMATTLAHDVEARVCAVEVNWWHPGMHQYLAGQPPALRTGNKRKQRKSAAAMEPPMPGPDDPGLGAVVQGTLALEKALVPTDRANLWLLPAGFVAPDARSAVARSSELKAVFASLAEQFDYLFIDVPAVATSSDTLALTSLAEAACVVVRHGVTPINTVKLALDEVKHMPVLGVVLNQVNLYTPDWILGLLPQE